MRRMALVLLSVSRLGCGQDRVLDGCPAVAAAGLAVSLTSEATAQPVCDASVTAADGSYSERLMQTSCTYVGAFDRPGTYVVRAEEAGFVPKEIRQVQVVMGSGRCPHVQEVRLAVRLAPQA